MQVQLGCHRRAVLQRTHQAHSPAVLAPVHASTCCRQAAPVSTQQASQHNVRAVRVEAAGKGGGSSGKGFGAPVKSAKPLVADTAPCPCGSGKEYQACCGPYHRGTDVAPTPEALLRSRYSAYAAKLVDYIVATTHPDAPEFVGSKTRYAAAIKSTMSQMDPLRLDIKSVEPASASSPDEAFITFGLERRIRDPKVPKNVPEVDTVTERSRFVRLRGRWTYMDSQFLE